MGVMEFLSEIFSGINLTEIVVIPVVAYLAKAIKGLIESWIAQKQTEASTEAYGQTWDYAHHLVQSCFVQIIEPAWKEFKDNPDDANVKMRYQNALKLAKSRATDQMKAHLSKLPAFLSDLLADKIDDMIESAIPSVKALNSRNP